MKIKDLLKDPLSEAIEGGMKGLIEGGADMIDRFVMSKEEKAKAKTEWQNLLQQHELALQEAAIKQEQLHQADRDSARKMQIAALQQNSWYAKNFVYLLSTITIVGAFGFAVALFFVTIPEKNTRLVEMFADLFLFAGGASVFNFFLGSSAGSSKKTDLMAQLRVSNSPPSEGGAGGGSQQAQPDDIDETFLSERQKRKRRKLSEE